MSVNLNKNKAAILDAYKKVTENQDGYDFAIFGYEGKSNDLLKNLKKIIQDIFLFFFANFCIFFYKLKLITHKS